MNTQFSPETIVVSFSGGRTSAYMLWRLLKEYPNAKFHVVFANTGKEREETLIFVKECEDKFGIKIHWVEARVSPEKGVGTSYVEVDFDSASRKGEPFEAVIKKYGIPGPSHPHCSRELKIVPIAKWIKDNVVGEYELAIGMRYDEQERQGDFWYPLMEQWRVTKPMVRQFWKEQDFDLQLADYEGNCDLCYKKTLNKKLTIAEKEPDRIGWWEKMENEYGNGHVMSREYVKFSALRTLLARGKFRRVTDENIPRNQQTIFDIGLSCSCGVMTAEDLA